MIMYRKAEIGKDNKRESNINMYKNRSIGKCIGTQELEYGTGTLIRTWEHEK